MRTPNVLCEITEIGGRHLNLPVGAEENMSSLQLLTVPLSLQKLILSQMFSGYGLDRVILELEDFI